LNEPTVIQRTEADAVSEISLRNAVRLEAPKDLAQVLVRITPTGHETIDLAKFLPAPRRKAGSVTLHDAASFAAYVNRHKTPATVLYAHREASKVVAVINDHATDVPGWGDHVAVLQIVHTKEWNHWAGKDGKLISQGEFAEHIEQGLEEITEPPAADMLELAQSFEAHSQVQFKSAKLLQDGSRQLVYQETVDARAGQSGNITIPREFTLGVAPYEGTDPYKVTARLRYRLQSEHLVLGYQLIRPEQILKAAFADVLAAIQADTGLLPLLGVHS
jgi:uncharacterized protein YfdQ (DUF2303 family)